MKEKKVMVSGCFDLIHAGHISFFKTAFTFGKLYVFLGRDKNILHLKGKAPYFSEQERKFVVGSCKYVEEAAICSGMGILDFELDLLNLKPDIFIVNADGHTLEKQQLCANNGVEYVILDRTPEVGLPVRSSSEIKKTLRFPYRMCLAGGWMDQPWVSEICPGSAVVAQIWPTNDFNERSGMATSSRNIAKEIWDDNYPKGNPIRNAQLLFGAENPPYSKYISGSQDQIGLLMPGINRLYYNGGFWPEKIDSSIDPDICNWLSDVLHLFPLKDRPDGYDPIKIKNLTANIVNKLAKSGNECYDSILKKDTIGLGKAMTDTFMAWSEMLPLTVPKWVMEEMEDKYINKYPGAITSGAGGGYAFVVSDKPIEGALKIKVKF